jgi:hypothetical protein
MTVGELFYQIVVIQHRYPSAKPQRFVEDIANILPTSLENPIAVPSLGINGQSSGAGCTMSTSSTDRPEDPGWKHQYSRRFLS